MEKQGKYLLHILLGIFLAVAMIFALASCGNDNERSESVISADSETNKEQTTDSEDSSAKSENGETVSEKSENSKSAETEASEESSEWDGDDYEGELIDAVSFELPIVPIP